MLRYDDSIPRRLRKLQACKLFEQVFAVLQIQSILPINKTLYCMNFQILLGKDHFLVLFITILYGGIPTEM